MTQLINKALVVDDSRLARIALSKLLQKRGVEVEVVGTGGEALDFLRGQVLPDVVFMDYMMPDMDGFEATRSIRDEHADAVPVVMYTSQDTADDREKARQLGIAGFLSKPSGEHNLDDVLSQLNSLLAERDSEAGPEEVDVPAAGAPETSGAAEDAPAATADEVIETDTPPAPGATVASEPDTQAIETPAPSETASESEAGEDVVSPEPEPEPEPESETWSTEAAFGAPASEREPSPAAPASADEADGWPQRPAAAPAAAVATSAEPAPQPATTSEPAPGLVQDVVDKALDRFARERLEPLREQIESSSGSEALMDEARQAARSAAEAAAESVADRTARQIAENVAQETAQRVSEEVGPEAAKRIMVDVRKDVKSYVSELLGSDGFKKQVTEIVRETAWPAVQQQVTEQVAAAVAEKVQETARETAAAEVKKHSEEASEVAGRLVDERVAALRANLTTSTRETVNESMTGIKRLIMGVGAGLGVAILASFAFTLITAG
jgi:CheY-like chemotaxis protein